MTVRRAAVALAAIAAVLLVLTLGAASYQRWSSRSAEDLGLERVQPIIDERPDIPVRFAVAGDLGATDHTVGVFEGAAAAEADFFLALGDLKYDDVATEQEWCSQAQTALGPGVPLELLAGNHDTRGDNGDLDKFLACAPNRLPNIVGDYGREWYVDIPAEKPVMRLILISPNITFEAGTAQNSEASVDSDEPVTWSYGLGTTHRQWLVSSITSARVADIPWVVVGMHKNCLDVGKHPCEIGPDLMTLLLDERVDLVLQAHTHQYTRSHQLSLSSSCLRWHEEESNPACIAARGSDFTAGVGTVVVTSGLGGHSVYNALEEPDQVFMAAVSAANLQPSFGPAIIDVTSDRVSGQFLVTSGGPFDDAFSITKR